MNKIEQYHHLEVSPDMYERLAAVHREAFAKYKDMGINMRGVVMTAASLREQMERVNETIFVMREGAEIVACIRGAIEKDIWGNTFLRGEGLAVMPACSKKGYGIFLVMAREKWAKKEGAQYARLDTSNRAEDTKKYHHSCGYKNWYYAYFQGRNYLSIYMRKDFGPAYPEVKRLARLCSSYLCIRMWHNQQGERTLICRARDFVLRCLRYCRRCLVKDS